MTRLLNRNLKLQMNQLRKKGYSLSEIAEELHIAKSTASRHVGSLLPVGQDLKRLNEKRGGSKKRKEIREGKALAAAKAKISELSTKEKELFLAALYWAEGSKKDFGLSNTDPAMIQIFVNGLREIFSITDDRFRVSIRIYEDLDMVECLQFWSKIVNIPQEKFVSVNILEGKKKGKLPYGMCRIRVAKGEELLKKFKAINSIVHMHFVPIA